jgi:hypothetical protein
MVIFNGRKRPPVNRASQVTLRDLEPAGTEQCNLQLPLFATERQRDLAQVVALSKTCLKYRSV